jgi:c-di-GMP-binding flagellar brake protein YcgR
MRETERRQFHRVTLVLPIEYRVIDREEFMSLSETIIGMPGKQRRASREQYRDDASPGAGNEDYGALSEQMALLNRKMDAILDLLFQGKVYHNAHERHAEVELSGSGIKFVSDVALEEGAYVDLKLLLPVLPYLKIPILCQVVRSRKLDRGLFEAAMQFVAMSEFDNDFLRRFLFMKEREALRSSRDERRP